MIGLFIVVLVVLGRIRWLLFRVRGIILEMMLYLSVSAILRVGCLIRVLFILIR